MELDILMVIAEVAVALAGFSAVVANFSGNWTAAKSQQLANLLIQSGIALFASMVPLIMSLKADNVVEGYRFVWWVSSASYIFFASVFLAITLLRASRPKSSVHGVDRIFFATFCVAILALVYNLYVGPQGWIYLLALLANVAYAFISFCLLIQPLVKGNVET